MATVDDKKIIFSMVGLNKTIQQNNKQVLKNIYLSFFYGAKIGIIGLNGSGKSTLLKIIAGLDKSYQGEVVFSPGYSVGYLAQEPYLDPTKTVKEIVMEGVQPLWTRWQNTRKSIRSLACPNIMRTRTRWTSSSPARPSCRTSLTRPMPGTLTASWNAPWTPSVVRPKTSP